MNVILSMLQPGSRLRESLSPWPGLYLVFSLAINIGLGYPVSGYYALAFTALLLLLGRQWPRVQKGLLLSTALLAGFYYPFGQAYGPPNFNTLLALHATNVAEASEILQVFPWSSYLIGVAIMACGALALRGPQRPRRRFAWFDAACLLVTAVAALTQPLLNATHGGVFSLTDAGFPLVRFTKDTLVSKLRVDEELARMQALTAQEDDWTVSSVNPGRQIYVLVIGESARRDALGAFGGRWSNTPWMSAAKGQLFTHYISAASSTQKSLGLTLNRVQDGKPLYQDNIITLANRAGFSTWWLSNQGQIGQYDTPIASIARRAGHAQFLKRGDFEADKSTRDTDLLALLPPALAQPVDKPRLVVLHLMGSHPKTCDRTGGRYQTFFHSPELSCYLESIRQTDQFLQELHARLHASGLSWSMIYFSDHGMAVKSRGTSSAYLAHDDRFRQNYDVPLFITASGDTQRQTIAAPRSANDFLTLFVQWTGIRTPQVRTDWHFMSSQSAGPQWVTNFALKRRAYDTLPEDPLGP
ncbi:phosphoethanolamine transferase [Pantoea sp. 1.19]|uniref:phosphoethanolamine transferase n=1 Tax=Pantoea sp. 1.19 TaxID=1925589 RepID=UPI0009488AD1|nr:sulfatase-like hydrolase/transferase [Pantoea sp. 1.19]